MKADTSPNEITEEEFNLLKEYGASDQEIVEALEAMTLFTGLNRFCDALGIERDSWL